MIVASLSRSIDLSDDGQLGSHDLDHVNALDWGQDHGRGLGRRKVHTVAGPHRVL
jgi:hypothetical protein